MNMNANTHCSRKRRIARAVSATFAACLVLQPASAAVSIANVPLLTGTAVAPNIMFVLDDSGSMQWEAMPDSIRSNTKGQPPAYVFPLPDNGNGTNLYGASIYFEDVPNFSEGNPENLRWRSSSNNTIFYDPAITYQPWLRFNGTTHVPVTGDAIGNVDPTNAPYNPAYPARGTLNLNPASALSKSAYWITTGTGTDCYWSECASSFWPVTYYVYKGSGSVTAADSYVRYQIRNSVGYKKDPAGSGSESSVTQFSWPLADGTFETRTVAEELQNFANWFSYYRSRTLAARGGASRAFAEVDTEKRLGYTTINHPGEADYTFLIDTGTTFTGSNRTSWFDGLLGMKNSTSGTPLRSALQWAGEYYSSTSTGASNPWYPAAEAECRRSFTILTSDGYWNGSYPNSNVNSLGALGNADGSGGPVHTSDLGDPTIVNFGYTASAPYQDSYSDTLADIAMYFWKNDLQTAANRVSPIPGRDPAYWQHMTTFTLSIGVQGTLDPDVVAKDDTFAAWPSPTSGTEDHKIDDLLHAAVNSRGRFISARNPEEFTDGLRAALQDIDDTAGSAASLSGNSTSVSTGSKVYQARFTGGDWSGDLIAWSLDSTSGSVAPSGTDADGNALGAWYASEQMPSPSDRKIYTSLTGAAGSLDDFDTSTSGLNATALNLGASDPSASDLVAYIRGSSAKEGVSTGSLRQRTRATSANAPLGDIVNSSPAFIGSSPNRVYDRTTLPGATSYQSFRDNTAARANLIYVGANDGMLHAFNATTGKEVFAYVPKTVLPKLKALAELDYGHEFYVDGDIVVEDVFDGSNWRTVLVASLGRGGRALIALDVTNPTSGTGASMTGNLASSDLLWELQGNSTNKLGYALGSPVIAPMNDGTWRAIIGNGYNAGDGKAYLLLANLFDASDVVVLSTDNNATAEGLGGVGGWDNDGDGDVDFLYSGDLAGRLWKFDVSSTNKNGWSVANKSGSVGTPVLQATDASGNPQPIVAPPTVGSHPDTGELWIFFGTGRFISTGDRSDASIQTWYGVRDPIVDDVPSAANRDRDVLVERLITHEGEVSRADGSKAYVRLISDSTDTSASAGNEAIVDASGNYVKHGWYIDLKVSGGSAAGERMLVRNVLLTDVLLGSTFIPNNDVCGSLGDGWLMAVYPWLGGRPLESFFDVNGDGDVDEGDEVGDPSKTVTGFKHGNGGVPYLQQCDDGLCVTGTTTDGEKPPTTVEAADGARRGRLSWRELVGE